MLTDQQKKQINDIFGELYEIVYDNCETFGSQMDRIDRGFDRAEAAIIEIIEGKNHEQCDLIWGILNDHLCEYDWCYGSEELKLIHDFMDKLDKEEKELKHENK